MVLEQPAERRARSGATTIQPIQQRARKGLFVMHGTVTVRKVRERYTSQFSMLPDKTFGPWDMAEMIRDLKILALLSPIDARSLVFDAAVKGEATTDVAR